MDGAQLPQGYSMDGVQLPQGYRATTRWQFAFSHKFPEILDIHLIVLGRMKGCVDLSAVLNPGPLAWEPSALTARSLILKE